MALSIIQKAKYAMNEHYTEEYRASIFEYEKKTRLLRTGYVPGVIRHYYHGSKKNRNYGNRWKLLVDNEFSPNKHLSKNKDGILIPTSYFPKQLLTDIINYFKDRNEDEMYEGGDFSKRIKSFSSVTSDISEEDNCSVFSTLFNAFDSFVNRDV